jgi:hypothetical protein
VWLHQSAKSDKSSNDSMHPRSMAPSLAAFSLENKRVDIRDLTSLSFGVSSSALNETSRQKNCN